MTTGALKDDEKQHAKMTRDLRLNHSRQQNHVVSGTILHDGRKSLVSAQVKLLFKKYVISLSECFKGNVLNVFAILDWHK